MPHVPIHSPVVIAGPEWNGGVSHEWSRSYNGGTLYLQAVELYLEGLGFRSIDRFLKVSHVMAYNWIRVFGQKKNPQFLAGC